MEYFIPQVEDEKGASERPLCPLDKKNTMNTTCKAIRYHNKVDADMKLILIDIPTDVATHDSQVLEVLIDKDNACKKFCADAAYVGKDESIKWCGMPSEVHEKGTSTRKHRE